MGYQKTPLVSLRQCVLTTTEEEDGTQAMEFERAFEAMSVQEDPYDDVDTEGLNGVQENQELKWDYDDKGQKIGYWYGGNYMKTMTDEERFRNARCIRTVVLAMEAVEEGFFEDLTVAYLHIMKTGQ